MGKHTWRFWLPVVGAIALALLLGPAFVLAGAPQGVAVAVGGIGGGLAGFAGSTFGWAWERRTNTGPYAWRR